MALPCNASHLTNRVRTGNGPILRTGSSLGAGPYLCRNPIAPILSITPINPIPPVILILYRLPIFTDSQFSPTPVLNRLPSSSESPLQTKLLLPQLPFHPVSLVFGQEGANPEEVGVAAVSDDH